MRQDAVSYLRDQLENAIDNYGDQQLPDFAIEAIVKEPIARGHMLRLILEEMTGDDRAGLIPWDWFVKASEREQDHWQVWCGSHGGWVTVSFLRKGTYGASLKDAPPGLRVIARHAPERCTAHLRCLAPQHAQSAIDEDAYDEQYEAMDYDHLNDPGR